MFNRNSKQSKSKPFVLLEKEAVVVSDPQINQVIVPNLQTCICLILWHKGEKHNTTAVIHANGTGNEVATCNYLVAQFDKFDPKDIKAYLVGGYHSQKRGSFFTEYLSWQLGTTSNAIAHPIINVLKKAGIALSRTERNGQIDSGRASVDTQTGEIEYTKEEFDERKGMKGLKGQCLEDFHLIKNELNRRKISTDTFETHVRSTGGAYQLWENDQMFKGPLDNCADRMQSWFPKI